MKTKKTMFWIFWSGLALLATGLTIFFGLPKSFDFFLKSEVEDKANSEASRQPNVLPASAPNGLATRNNQNEPNAPQATASSLASSLPEPTLEQLNEAITSESMAGYFRFPPATRRFLPQLSDRTSFRKSCDAVSVQERKRLVDRFQSLDQEVPTTPGVLAVKHQFFKYNEVYFQLSLNSVEGSSTQYDVSLTKSADPEGTMGVVEVPLESQTGPKNPDAMSLDTATSLFQDTLQGYLNEGASLGAVNLKKHWPQINSETKNGKSQSDKSTPTFWATSLEFLGQDVISVEQTTKSHQISCHGGSQLLCECQAADAERD